MIPFLLPLCMSLEEPTVEITSFPEQIASATPFTVVTELHLNRLVQENRRVCLVLEMIDSQEGILLQQWVDDNGGRGFWSATDRIITIDTFPADATATTQVYWRAYLAPFDLNDLLLEQIQTYPMDGTHDYRWVQGSTGHSYDLYYDAEFVIEGGVDGTTYCCGVTFQAFLEAADKYRQLEGAQPIAGLDAQSLRAAREFWYGDAGSMDRQVVHWLQATGLGIELENPFHARAGDLIQYWRFTDFGHAAIFIDWIREDDQVVGVKYWSSQRKTQGIGFNEEYFGEPRGICWHRTAFGRIKKPRDQRDWLTRYADDSTASTPTLVEH